MTNIYAALELEPLGPSLSVTIEMVGRDIIAQQWGVRVRTSDGKAVFIPTGEEMAKELAQRLGSEVWLVFHAPPEFQS